MAWLYRNYKSLRTTPKKVLITNVLICKVAPTQSVSFFNNTDVKEYTLYKYFASRLNSPGYSGYSSSNMDGNVGGWVGAGVANGPNCCTLSSGAATFSTKSGYNKPS